MVNYKMEFREMIDFKGKIQFKCQVTLPTGKIIVLKEWTTENLITNNGRTLLITRVGSNTPDPISHIALGTGSTPAAFTDTALVSEKHVYQPLKQSREPLYGIVFLVGFLQAHRLTIHVK